MTQDLANATPINVPAQPKSLDEPAEPKTVDDIPVVVVAAPAFDPATDA